MKQVKADTKESKEFVVYLSNGEVISIRRAIANEKEVKKLMEEIVDEGFYDHVGGITFKYSPQNIVKVFVRT